MAGRGNFQVRDLAVLQISVHDMYTMDADTTQEITYKCCNLDVMRLACSDMGLF